MKKLLTFLPCFAALCAFGDATVSDVTVTQLWPFSTDLKITYTLAGASAAAPVNVKLAFFDGDTQLATTGDAHNAITGDLAGLSTDGVKTIHVETKKVFNTAAGSLSRFKVTVTPETTTAEKANEVLYRIYTLKGVKNYSGVAPTEVTRSDLLNGKYGTYETDFSRIGEGFNTTLTDVLIWTGVTNGWTYKTDKLVMRKIPAKDVEWTMGSPESCLVHHANETQHKVRLTEDFFIGVFDLTQAQMTNLYSTTIKYWKDYPDSPIRPITAFTYNDVRGQTGWGEKTASEGQKINWPTNVPQHTVYWGYGRLASNMRTYLRKDKNAPMTIFDLPTEAQWEFACRAGTTNVLYSGKEPLVKSKARCANTDEIAWNLYSTYPDDTPQVMPVGMKAPNAFGLYDMIGNVNNMCLDSYADDVSTFWDENPSTGVMENVAHTGTLVDPVGPFSSKGSKPDRTRRGGNYGYDQEQDNSAYRIVWWTQDTSRQDDGIRLVCPAAADWKDGNGK